MPVFDSWQSLVTCAGQVEIAKHAAAAQPIAFELVVPPPSALCYPV